MLGKVKKWLGIEGVKLELDIPETVLSKDKEISGILRFESMNAQTVTYVKIILIEKYSRGRGTDKLIDEYELGKIEFEKTIEIPENEIVELDFTLPFSIVKSDVDEFGNKNFLFRRLAKAARYLQSVKSQYRLIAEAEVKGVALSPFCEKEFEIK